MLAAIVGLGVGSAWVHVRAAGDELGRLFFTPERRSDLDRQRHQNVEEARVVEGDSLTVNGVIRRSSGHSTVWINGMAHQDNRPTSDVTPRIDPRDPSRVVLKAGDDPPASLVVGESIDRTTGEKQDPLDGGHIVVGRNPGETPRDR